MGHNILHEPSVIVQDSDEDDDHLGGEGDEEQVTPMVGERSNNATWVNSIDDIDEEEEQPDDEEGLVSVMVECSDEEYDESLMKKRRMNMVGQQVTSL